MPTTRPRRALNQRVATVALNTSAVMPVPKPTTTPHSRINCQILVMPSDSSRLAVTIEIEIIATLRRPKRLSSAAANGAISPNSIRRIETAVEISAVVQPNSFCSGRMNTPGAAPAPALTSAVRKVTATITQP